MDNEKWCTAPVECPLCTREWVAVYPQGTPKLECPTCGNLIIPIIKDIQNAKE